MKSIAGKPVEKPHSLSCGLRLWRETWEIEKEQQTEPKSVVCNVGIIIKLDLIKSEQQPISQFVGGAHQGEIQIPKAVH